AVWMGGGSLVFAVGGGWSVKLLPSSETAFMVPKLSGFRYTGFFSAGLVSSGFFSEGFLSSGFFPGASGGGFLPLSSGAGFFAGLSVGLSIRIPIATFRSPLPSHT